METTTQHRTTVRRRERDQEHDEQDLKHINTAQQQKALRRRATTSRQVQNKLTVCFSYLGQSKEKDAATIFVSELISAVKLMMNTPAGPITLMQSEIKDALKLTLSKLIDAVQHQPTVKTTRRVEYN